MEILSRFIQGSPHSYFIFGRQGTGKSTWIKEHYRKSLLIDLMAPDVYRRCRAKCDFSTQ